MITLARLHELLDYDPATGTFRWTVVRKHNRAGKVAGTSHNGGYWSIRIDGIRYLAHRLAIFYMTGLWPIEGDHHNRNKRDNRAANLRPATRSQNAANAGMPCNNTSGVKGVSFNRAAQKWVVYVGREHWGTYDDFDIACLIRHEAAAKTYGEFSHG